MPAAELAERETGVRDMSLNALDEMQPAAAVTMGTCRCCGQKKVVPDAMNQAEADLEATRNCNCQDGVAVRRQIAEKDTVAEMLPDVEEQVCWRRRS